MVVVKRVAKAVLSVAAVVALALLLSTCGSQPAPGDPCGRSELWHTTTLDNGDVLECQHVWGAPDRMAWTLVGHNETSGDLVWLGWLAAVIGAAVVTAGVVGIAMARYGRRRPVRRLE